MDSPPTIVVTDYDWPDLSIERSVVGETSFELRYIDASDPADIVADAPDADALLVQYASIPAQVFEELGDLQVVGRTGIGVDSIDVESATAHGVVVVNVPSYCEDEVAVHTLGLLFSCLRKIPLYDRAIKDGVWDWTIGKPIRRMEGQTWGLVGFGKIPQRLARYLSGFDLDVISYDPYQSVEAMAAYDVEKVTFEELLTSADFVSIHAPLTEETRHMFGAREFELMDEDAILINTARGGLIDTEALDEAIASATIAGAGIDVMPNEPPAHFEVLDHDAVVGTPHVAWYSEESNTELRRTVTEDIVGVLQGNPPRNPVN